MTAFNNIDPRDIKALKLDLSIAWTNRNKVVDIVDGELVESEEADDHKRVRNADAFMNSIDPENMETLRAVWDHLPGHYSIHDAAMYVMKNYK